MAYNLIASNSHTWGGNTWDFRLYEEGASITARDLIIVGAPIFRRGRDHPEALFEPLLASDVDFRVLDKDRFLVDRMKGKWDTDFKLEVDKDSSLYFCGPLSLSHPPEPFLFRGDPAITLTAYDGLQNLKTNDYGLTGSYTAAKLYRALLDNLTCDLDAFLYFSWQHENQDTSTPHALGFRHAGGDWILGNEEATELDVLKEMTRFYQAQIIQDEGVWRVLQRSYRGGSMDYVRINTDDTTATGSEDRTLTLSAGDIQNARPIEITAPPATSATSTFAFDLHRVRNGDFSEWKDDSTPVHWDNAGSGLVSQKVVDGTKIAAHNGDTEALLQETTQVISSGSVLDVAMKWYFKHTSSPSPGTLSPEVARVKLTNTDSGDEYWMQGSGAWDTVEREHLLAIGEADGFVERTRTSDPLPESGTITLETVFEADADEDGTNDFQWYGPSAFDFEARHNAAFQDEDSYTAAGASYGDVVEETFYVGDKVLDVNYTDGVMEYLDATSAAWEQTTDWSPDTNNQPIHKLRAQSRSAQQATGMRGLDIKLIPGREVSLADTVIYDSVKYIPVYIEHDIYRRTRRIVCYELL